MSPAPVSHLQLTGYLGTRPDSCRSSDCCRFTWFRMRVDVLSFPACSSGRVLDFLTVWFPCGNSPSLTLTLLSPWGLPSLWVSARFLFACQPWRIPVRADLCRRSPPLECVLVSCFEDPPSMRFKLYLLSLLLLLNLILHLHLAVVCSPPKIVRNSFWEKQFLFMLFVTDVSCP